MASCKQGRPKLEDNNMIFGLLDETEITPFSFLIIYLLLFIHRFYYIIDLICFGGQILPPIRTPSRSYWLVTPM